MQEGCNQASGLSLGPSNVLGIDSAKRLAFGGQNMNQERDTAVFFAPRYWQTMRLLSGLCCLEKFQMSLPGEGLRMVRWR